MSASNNFSTVSQLSAQWTNPSDVLSLLLIIGGDIVQTALAQTAGGWITPVCFSFGWVAYSFSTVIRVLGDGRLLPVPDYPVKVFNLKSSYMRENRNWVLGRILRDNEVFMNKHEPDAAYGIRISIYVAEKRKSRSAPIHMSELCWLMVTLVQLGVAAIPLAIDGEWGIFLVTSTGIAAAFLAGQLPQWRIEKLPFKQDSQKHIALTSGNGSREIMIIYGAGNCLDLEELAAGESPRSDRAWKKSHVLSRPVKDKGGKGLKHQDESTARRTIMWQGLPAGLWITRLASFCQIVFWVALLITVAGLRSHSWYLVVVGSLGMLQNAMLGAVARKPERRDLPLRHVDTIATRKVMDGLMDLEATIGGAGVRLLDEFFPGFLTEKEIQWWAGGDRNIYDNERVRDRTRGEPRSRLEPRELGIPDVDLNGRGQMYSRTSTWNTMPDAAEEVEMQAMPARTHATIPGAQRNSNIEVQRQISTSKPQVYTAAKKLDSSMDTISSPEWT
ncbi:hypothetical protein AA0111_g10418 [Alternaria arborescens]|uniref:hypothetical protein n=1 Tax=Alternaria arborescens TaxID=156630 RepID=UPI00107524E5|nr:hypothetical protein AA0111_g10418 [Alternaria arborescens]RYO19223.1 hypothetical protein AA0111_g10418 [Alternaria arborescens]